MVGSNGGFQFNAANDQISEENVEEFTENVKLVFEKSIGKEAMAPFSQAYIQSVVLLTTVCESVHFVQIFNLMSQ